MPDSFQYDVFLSHNSADKPRVWFDEWTAPAEASQRRRMRCLSPAALGSDWVGLERSTVLFRDPANAGRRFIPLLLAECKLPDTLRCDNPKHVQLNGTATNQRN